MVSPVRGDYRRCQAETPLIDLFKFAGPALYNHKSMTTDKVKAKIQELCPDVMERKRAMNLKGEQYILRSKVITLAVVLRAIGNMLVVVDAAGNFYKLEMKMSDKMPKFGKPTNVRWNLEHDNYDQQSEECKQFIGSLLG